MLGLRHGVDWDHVAAVADLTASARRGLEALRLSLLYAAGHAAVVMALAAAVVGLGTRLPSSLDGIMDRVVGTTLIVMAGYVLHSLAIRRELPRSVTMTMLDRLGTARDRWKAERLGLEYETIEHSHPHVHDRRHPHEHSETAVANRAGASPAATVVIQHSHPHKHTLLRTTAPFSLRKSAVVVGALHGIGAETPTQISLLATATGVEGPARAATLVLVFITGMLISNSTLAVVMAAGSEASARARVAVSIGAAAASGWLGVSLLMGAR